MGIISRGDDDGGAPEPQDGGTSSDGDVTDKGDVDNGVEVTADALLALVNGCPNKLSSSPYASDVGRPANIDVCGLAGSVYWKSDMDIDCDGKRTDVCNEDADPSFAEGTAASDSNGDPLDAAKLPFVVVPLKSSRFDYKAAGLALGNVVAVIYNGKIEYGVIGDLGPSSIIGEASYAMAKNLGINPNPATGGTSSGVTYIAFKGTSAKVTPIEDHARATTLGKQLAQKLLAGIDTGEGN
jgi:hypothetical protein